MLYFSVLWKDLRKLEKTTEIFMDIQPVNLHTFAVSKIFLFWVLWKGQSCPVWKAHFPTQASHEVNGQNWIKFKTFFSCLYCRCFETLMKVLLTGRYTVCQNKKQIIIFLFPFWYKVLLQEKPSSITTKSAASREEYELKSKTSTFYAKEMDSCVW